MERSEGSSSNVNSNSLNRSYGQTIWGPLCRCSKVTTMAKAWTNDNPGRRFYKCDTHGFFRWFDEENPHGWQKVSLLEARDQIRQQKEEIKLLTDSLRVLNQQMLGTMRGTSMVSPDSRNKQEQEKLQLENEVITSKEREKLLRQFIVISWGGFILVTALILTMVKK